jgi:hypothetical protein
LQPYFLRRLAEKATVRAHQSRHARAEALNHCDGVSR